MVNTEGLPWLINKILIQEPKSLMDIEAGDGKLGQLLRQHLPKARLMATGETSAAVADAQLWRHYDAVMIGTATDCSLTESDVFVIRDFRLLDRVLALATRATYLVCPVEDGLRIAGPDDLWMGSNTVCMEFLSTSD